jgi:sarcosine oxidase, subunit beta
MTDKRTDVCIIGGGLMGCFAALFLGQRGRSAIVLEKGAVGREASGVNFGNLRLQGRKPVEFPLSLTAHDLWERFETLTAESCGFAATGHAYLAFGAADHPKLEHYAQEANAAGIDVTVLDAADVRRRWPSLSALVSGATWSPRDGAADPALAAPAVARAARRAGIEILEATRATRIEPAGQGFRVATDRDVSITCGHVVNAAGAWANSFAAALGEPTLMFAAGPPIIATAPVAPLGIPSMLAVDGSIIFRQTASGEVITSSFPRQPSDLDTGAAPIPQERIARDLTRLAEVVPALRAVDARRAWSGVEGYLPDMLPVLGASHTTPGVVHAFGFSGHGFQLAPGVGRVVADLIVDGRSDIPIPALSIARFAAGVATDERLAREFEPAAVTRATRPTGV